MLNAVLAHPEAARQIAPGLYSVLPESDAAPYDRKAAFYDAVVGRPIYHRLVWGTSFDAHARFARAAFDDAAACDGCFAEIGCGSLLFTAPMYRDSHARSVILVDRSIGMLRRGLKRLGADREEPCDGVLALHADAAALPFRPAIFSTVLCLALVHVPCDAPAILTECRRILAPDRGRLFVSSLVRSGRWADKYMSLLHQAGELAAPRTVNEVHEMITRAHGIVESTKLEGNMCFLIVRYPG